MNQWQTILEPSEVTLALNLAVMRQVRATYENRRGAFGATEDFGKALANHALGAIGELAFCKIMRITWDTSLNRFGVGDFGPLLELKTRSSRTYQNMVRPSTPDNVMVALMRPCPAGFPREMEFAGWNYAGEAKCEEWLQTYGGRAPAYFVPDDHLRPPESLDLSQEATHQ